MTVLSYLAVLSLPFLMPFIARFLEEITEERELRAKAKARDKAREQAKKATPSSYCPQGEISEALQILELPPNPSEYEIRMAHRRMIARNHPDQGGSMYFAAKINYARDILLRTVRAA